jgi:hypothetical protein
LPLPDAARAFVSVSIFSIYFRFWQYRTEKESNYFTKFPIDVRLFSFDIPVAPIITVLNHWEDTYENETDGFSCLWSCLVGNTELGRHGCRQEMD